jgi:hypothetical protein
MSSDDGADSRGSRFARLISPRLLYPLGGTLVIFLLLAYCERSTSGDPNRLYGLFQSISVVFFAALAFRLLLRPTGNTGQESRNSKSSDRGLRIALAADAISYVRTLPLFFVCDDFAHLELVRRPFVVSIWPEFTKGQDGVFYRPLAFVSLFLDYRVWHEWIPGYHLTNVFLHLICIAGVFYLCKQLEWTGRSCFAAALFFAVLPVNVQNVTWAAARFDQLAAAFGIWSIACAASFRRTGRARFYWFAICLFVLAVLSKENAYVFPVLWLTLEMVPMKGAGEKPSIARRAAILVGYLGLPAIMMLFRFFLLSGVGGYRRGDAPMALHFPIASVFGLLVRAPGETLFGYDWLEPGDHARIMAAILTAAIFLMLAFWMKTDARSRRVICFALIWIVVSAAPAHFYFWGSDPGLFVSRTLYFGSIGVAMLIAVLLEQVVSQGSTYRVWAVSIGLLLFAGTQHNISAWQRATREAHDRLTAVKREQPSPPSNATYYVTGVPDQYRGVPFFAAGHEAAIRMSYSWREDIHVVRDKATARPDGGIVIKYGKARE